MKVKHCLILSLMLLMGLPTIHAQIGVKSDVALTAAVLEMSRKYNEEAKQRRTLQGQILAAEAGTALALENIHKIESDMVDYLSNANSAVSNLYQIKQCLELATVTIPKNFKALKDALAANPKSAVLGISVDKVYIDIVAQAVELYAFLKPLVLSGSVDTKTGKKVNLLNAAERYHILNTTYSKLWSLNHDLLRMRSNAQYAGWGSLLHTYDRETWYNLYKVDLCTDQIVRDIKGLGK